MSAETPAAPSLFARWRMQFRAWRGTRPFWAGLYVMIGGVPIMYFPYANLTIGQLTIRMSTTAGAGSLIIGILLVVLGITLWFQKHIRTFAGVAAILLALVSLPVSNFGGFFVGFLFGMVGGAMAMAWVPGGPQDPQAVQESDGGQGDAPESAALDLSKPGAGTDVLPAEDATDGPTAGAAPQQPHDLSVTSPVTGTNGRHSVG